MLVCRIGVDHTISPGQTRLINPLKIVLIAIAIRPHSSLIGRAHNRMLQPCSIEATRTTIVTISRETRQYTTRGKCLGTSIDVIEVIRLCWGNTSNGN